MYLQHFSLNTDPFPMATKLFFVFPSRAYGETMAHLVYGIEQEEGIVLISGGIGTGKTLALQSLLDQLTGPLDPVLVNVTQMSWLELLRYILLEMGEKLEPNLGLADLVQRLKTVLLARQEMGRRVLLIIDEAQLLDTEALEGLRLLMNISSSENTCLQLILVGQPALEEAISRPELAQLNQRIRVRYRLEALSREELKDYVDHRIQAAGGEPGLFRKQTLDRVFELSEGVPRVVNILASRAMLAAFVEKRKHVEERHVRREDLPPLSDAPQSEVPASTIAVATPAIAPITPRETTRRRRVPVLVAILVPLLLSAAGAVAWQLDIGLVRTRLRGASDSAEPAAVVAAPTPEAEHPSFAGAAAAETASDLELAAPETAPDSPAPAVAAPQVVVHVASFRHPDRAASYMAILEAAGATVFSEQATAEGHTWVRVFLGPFADTEESSAVLARLEERGLVTYSQTNARNG